MSLEDADEDIAVPTPERAARGDVERAERPVISEPGEYTPPHIVVTLLADMQRRGTISEDERLAGERFATWFRLAEMDQLRAADMARPYVDGGGKILGLSSKAERAREEISK